MLGRVGRIFGSRLHLRPLRSVLPVHASLRRLCSADDSTKPAAQLPSAPNQASEPPPPPQPQPPVPIYHFAYIRHLRMLLRFKVLQLGAGVSLFLPAMTVYESGGALTGSQVGLLAAVVVGTVAAGGSLSWYCQRLVGELSWRPDERALRVSTLNVWGHRENRDFPLALLPELLAPSFVPSEDAATPLHEKRRSIPLHLGEQRTYLLLLHRPSLRDPRAVFDLLEGRVPPHWTMTSETKLGDRPV